MSKGVLFTIIALLLLTVVAWLVLNSMVGGIQSGQPGRSLEERLNPSPPDAPESQTPTAAAARVPMAPTTARADDTPPPEIMRPDPPKVTSVAGAWGRNPFLTVEEIDFLRNPRRYEVEPEPQPIRLSTILEVDGKRVAAVNGHYLSEGDYFLSEKVIKITRYAVTLQRENGKTREVRVHDPVVALTSRTRRSATRP